MISYFDRIFCICMQDRPAKKDRLLKQLDTYYPRIEPIVFDAVNTRKIDPGGHHIGCALSHRSVIRLAKLSGYKRIIVFEEDAIFRVHFTEHFTRAVEELMIRKWDLFYLGACVWKKEHDFEENCHYLRIPKRSTCTHGIAYNSSIYDFILSHVPDDIPACQQFCKEYLAIDQFYMRTLQNNNAVVASEFLGRKPVCYLAEPRIVSQPFLVGKEKQDDPEYFR